MSEINLLMVIICKWSRKQIQRGPDDMKIRGGCCQPRLSQISAVLFVFGLKYHNIAQSSLRTKYKKYNNIHMWTNKMEPKKSKTVWYLKTTLCWRTTSSAFSFQSHLITTFASGQSPECSHSAQLPHPLPWQPLIDRTCTQNISSAF